MSTAGGGDAGSNSFVIRMFQFQGLKTSHYISNSQIKEKNLHLFYRKGFGWMFLLTPGKNVFKQPRKEKMTALPRQRIGVKQRQLKTPRNPKKQQQETLPGRKWLHSSGSGSSKTRT